MLTSLVSKRFLWLALCLAAWLALPAQALEITRSEGLGGHWEIARDPTGQRTVQDMAQQEFKPLAGGLALGFSADTVWLRFTLSRSADAPPEWWLLLTPPFLDHLDLYVPQAAPGSYRTVRGGGGVPTAERPMPLRETVFALQLDTTPATYYLRLQSASTLALEATLISPRDFADRSMQYNTRLGLFLGLLLSSALISLLCALWMRESFLYIATAYLVAFGLTQLSVNGYDRYWLSLPWPELLRQNWVPPSGVYGCVLGGLHGLFVLSYLQVQAFFPRLRMALLASSVLCFVCAGLALLGFWGRIGGGFYALALLVTALMMALSLAMLRHRPDRARLMLLMFMPGLIGVVLQSSRNMGLLPLNFWTTEFWTLTVFFQVPFAAVVVLLRVRETYQLAADARARERVQRSLIDMMAHELRTPLAVVGAAIANLQARTLAQQPELLPRYQRLDTALARLNSVVDNALRQQRLHDPELQFHRVDTAPSALLEQVRALLTPDERHPLAFARRGEDQPLAMDAHWVALAVINLIDNAIKYSPDGGGVDILLERDAQGLSIQVSDTGIGIPSEALPHLFDRFYRAPNALALTSTTGMGLGLFLVQQVVLGHGGTLHAQSRPEGGSRFRITLRA